MDSRFDVLEDDEDIPSLDTRERNLRAHMIELPNKNSKINGKRRNFSISRKRRVLKTSKEIIEKLRAASVKVKRRIETPQNKTIIYGGKRQLERRFIIKM